MILSVLSFQTLPLSLSVRHSFSSFPLMHLPPSTSLLQIFNPLTSLNIPSGQFLCSKRLFSHLSHCIRHHFLSFILNAFIPVAILPGTTHTHCLEFIFPEIASFTFSFHSHLSPMLPRPILFPHTSSNAPKSSPS